LLIIPGLLPALSSLATRCFCSRCLISRPGVAAGATEPCGAQTSRQVESLIAARVHATILAVGIALLVGPRLRGVIVSLAERAAGSPAGKPRVDADSMESVATCKSADVVIVLEGVDANGTRVSWGSHALWWQGGIDMLVVVFVVQIRLCTMEVIRPSTRCLTGIRSLILLQGVQLSLFVVGGDFGGIDRGRSGLGISVGYFEATIRVEGHARNDAVGFSQTSGAARRYGNAASRREAFSGTFRHPRFVFHHGELLIYFIHRHEFLLTSATVGPGHVVHIDWLAIFIEHSCSVTGVVSEAVLDTNNDPEVREDDTKSKSNKEEEMGAGTTSIVLLVAGMAGRRQRGRGCSGRQSGGGRFILGDSSDVLDDVAEHLVDDSHGAAMGLWPDESIAERAISGLD
jgi:hypothetical protein